MSHLSIQNNANKEKQSTGITPQPNQVQSRNPQQERKVFVLCFDGTGNKFSGTDADSNGKELRRCGEIELKLRG